MTPYIIGLTGYARSGKDCFAKCLQRRGWHVMGFADPIYDACWKLNPIVFVWDWPSIVLSMLLRALHLPNQRFGVIPVPYRWIVRILGDTHAKRLGAIRRLYQKFGTEVCRELLGEDVFVQAALKKIRESQHSRIVITNVRFPNESQIVHKLVRISRPGYGPVNSHVSDAGLAFHGCHAVIVNAGTLQDLDDSAAKFLETHHLDQ